MKPHAPAGTDSRTEAQWVEGELVRNMMRTQRNTQYIGVSLIPVIAGVLWDDGPSAALLAWVAAALSVAAVRSWILRRYELQVRGRGAQELLAFHRRFRHFWPVSAFVWGLTVALHFDTASLADQFVCWLVLAGVAMFAINAFSCQLRTMRAYLNTLAFTALAAVGWHMAGDFGAGGLAHAGWPENPAHHWWLVGLLLLFWQLLIYAGERLHETNRVNYELQYRNNQLIESLTRQTQAALDAVEIKNRFLASAAHDIRQPVHALGLYADWLGSEPELVHELAPKIVDATKAVNQLFDSLFDMARLDSGKIRLNVETVDIAKLLRDLELQYRPLAEAKGLAFRLRVGGGSVSTDPILLQRIVGNLISNAIKYTRQGGVLVAARGSRRGPRIEVWDTGMGIAPEHQREIFREFYKVPTHGTVEGFGLGLYIVGRLTQILGHPLVLHSRPGRGSVFRLVLHPTDPQAAGERAVASVAQMVHRP